MISTNKHSFLSDCKGFSLVEVVVGVALVVIVFLGILGVYQSAIQILSQSRDRVTATSIAQGYIERARNLPYEDIGVQGQFPGGIFLATETVVRNGISYEVKADIDFIDHEADLLLGLGDACATDFKRVLIEVSWSGKSQGEVNVATDVAPLNDIQECANPGGKLALTVFDALGIPIENAFVSIDDVDSALADSCTTALNGQCSRLVPESPSGGEENYKIIVTKSGYSQGETFGSGDFYIGVIIAAPDPAHATILEGQVTQMSFSIDRLADLVLTTRSPRGRTIFSDEFNDSSNIAASNTVDIAGGVAQLEFSGGAYANAGDLTSITIGSAADWDEVSSTSTIPASTEIKLFVLYYDGFNWVLVPDVDLSGNVAGFTGSSIDLSGLNTSTYSSIRLKAVLSTSDTNVTPSLQEWDVVYDTLPSFPIGNVSMRVQGTKTVGQDAASSPIFKHAKIVTTNFSGNLTQELEWDLYTFSNFNQGGTSLDIDEIDPPENPVSILPGDSLSVDFYLAAQNSLLVNVQEEDTFLPVFSANVRLSSGSYDTTQPTNAQGQTLFIPLSSGLYTIDVTAAGYDPYTGSVNVSGDSTTTITIVKNPS